MSGWTLEGWIPEAKRQSDFFFALTLRHLPSWVAQDLRERRLSLCDFGCSVGDMVEGFAREFPGSAVTGVELDPVRVAKARERFPGREFLAADIRTLERQFDVVYTSNTLEHLSAPGEMLQVLAGKTRSYLICLVPFLEAPLSEGHCSRFEPDSFPPTLGPLRLLHTEVVDCRGLPDTQWEGLQLLAVYANPEAAPPARGREPVLARPPFPDLSTRSWRQALKASRPWRAYQGLRASQPVVERFHQRLRRLIRSR